jgi:hypothetical protein
MQNHFAYLPKLGSYTESFSSIIARWKLYCRFTLRSMSRYIECKLDDGSSATVWKYESGIQPFELSRIRKDLGIGDYYRERLVHDRRTGYRTERVKATESADFDILSLKREDIKKIDVRLVYIKQWLLETDPHYIAMVEAIKNFMIAHTEQEIFVFRGER